MMHMCGAEFLGADYSANHSDGTHFRVAVGYDPVADALTLLDPWDRDNVDRGEGAGGARAAVGAVGTRGGLMSCAVDGGKQPRVVTYSREDWCSLWSYAEGGSARLVQCACW